MKLAKTTAAPEPTPCFLCEQWLEAKRREKLANEQRIAIEQQLHAMLAKGDLLPGDDGSKTSRIGSFKVTVKHSLRYSLDEKGTLDALFAPLPPDVRPIKHEIDQTGVKWLRENRPDLYKVIAQGLTVKPAKPSISIESAE